MIGGRNPGAPGQLPREVVGLEPDRPVPFAGGAYSSEPRGLRSVLGLPPPLRQLDGMGPIPVGRRLVTAWWTPMMLRALPMVEACRIIGEREGTMHLARRVGERLDDGSSWSETRSPPGTRGAVDTPFPGPTGTLAEAGLAAASAGRSGVGCFGAWAA